MEAEMKHKRQIGTQTNSQLEGVKTTPTRKEGVNFIVFDYITLNSGHKKGDESSYIQRTMG